MKTSQHLHGNTREPASHIGGTIKALRIERHLSAAELAEALGVTENAITQIERQDNPRLSTIQKAAKFFHLSPSALLAIHEARQGK